MITAKTKTVTPRKVLELAQALSPADLHWLAEQLSQLLDDDLLPESATLEEAIDLFLADRCSLGRAAELASVTRWDIQDVLKERGIPIVIDTDMTAEEVDGLANELEREGLLC